VCGIAGYSGRFDPTLLAAMSRAVAHRGPDDDGTWVDRKAGIGLAHRRLSIIDLRPEARQPMSNEDDTLWLTYNGEIYNHLELRDELLAKGHRFKSASDSEVILHLYEEDGPEFISRLNGIFAFALWDGRRKELLLARDGMGVKPLYFAELRSGFLFASEIKSLIEAANLPREVDFEALHYYLAFLWAPAPFTPLRAVRKLEPGHAMVVGEGQIRRRWSFYDLPYCGQRRDNAADELAIELRDRLATAVCRQMVSDVPVGAFLSGGLDSSSVVAMMARCVPPAQIPCYSIGFGDDDQDGSPSDLPYARRVAEHLGVDLREIRVDPAIILQLERMIWHLDEPQGDPAPINAMLIAEQARRDGVKVLLSGAGGDDIFSGYRRHAALHYERLWGWLPLPMRRPLAHWSRDMRKEPAWRRRLARAFAYADRSPDGRLCSYFEWTPDEVRRALYGPEFARATAEVVTDAPLVQSLGRILDEPDRFNRMLYLEAKHFLADHNLNYTDKASMAHGIEVRVPLLDPDLVAFAATLPPSLKQRGREGKALFKRAMEPLLPHDVIYRPKTGFGVPLRRWLTNELREMVRDTLSESALRRRGWFDPGRVRSLIEANEAGRVDASYLIFGLLCLEIWCGLFLERTVVGRPEGVGEWVA
jgi:asparagine synthase (glutamine-hydrolysing)